MTALERAYASNTETPILTLEISHPGFLSDLFLFKGYGDILETNQGNFYPAAIEIVMPEKNTEGDQQMNFTVSNVGSEVMYYMRDIIDYNRNTNDSKATCILRTYLQSDIDVASPSLADEAGATIKMIITRASINRMAASFSATFSPFPNVYYPRRRYYPRDFTGLKYAR